MDLKVPGSSFSTSSSSANFVLNLNEKEEQLYEKCVEAAKYLLDNTKHRPTVGIVTGSGLSDVAEHIEYGECIEYKDIPHFRIPTAYGHRGRLIFGVLGEKTVVCMQGRLHTYEGYSAGDCALPVRVMRLIGVHTLFIANAAGGLNHKFRTGDIMVITDHVCFPALSSPNVLTGPNDERFGPRFPDMKTCYTRKFIDSTKAVMAAICLGWRLHEGVYAMIAGPAYATPAECKVLKLLGGDAVGMSNCWEVIAAHHCGMDVFAICVITDTHKEPLDALTHEQVMSASQRSAQDVTKLFIDMLKTV